ncbi:MAG: peptidoglycan DD-metalloendopeptidase family protein [Eubacteriales bacterium]
MSGSYRKKKGFLSVLFKDRGFYTILTVSMLMVCLAGYLALNYGNTENSIDTPTENIIEIEQNYKPDWLKDEDPTGSSVIEPIEDPTDSEVESPTDQENPPVVVFNITIDISDVRSVGVFSGTVPVFSETMNDWRMHQGIDFISDTEKDVFASAAGTVEDVYNDSLMGHTVSIRHADGSHSVYQSLSIISVAVGDSVTPETKIGMTGKTADCEADIGNHLHFAVVKEGKYLDPNDLFEIDE